MIIFFKKLAISGFLFLFLLLPAFVFAEGDGPLDKLKKVAEPAGYQSQSDSGGLSIGAIAGQVIGVFISVLGVIFIVLIVFAGYEYMMARGEEEKVKKSLATIRQAIVGLIITISAYAIWGFVFKYFVGA
ncbi:MAG: hypothetical protein WCW25_01220 [Patescibacteria group bacterium]|jgi:uncharacterized protein YqgC (DUF456 family)